MSSARSLITRKSLIGESAPKLTSSDTSQLTNEAKTEAKVIVAVDSIHEASNTNLPTHGRRRPSSQNRLNNSDKFNVHDRLYAASQGRLR